MIRGIKILVCSMATLCIGAVAAPAALAVPELHSEAEHTILTGESNVNTELSLDAGGFQCGAMRFDGTTQMSTTTTFGLTPTFENCVLDGMEAAFTHNGCNWRVHVGPNEGHLTGSVDFLCPEGQAMEIHVPACTITVLPQAGLQSVTFTNENAGAERSIILDLNLVGIHYVEHGMGCPNATETTNNGHFTGKVTITGENTMGAHRGIWVE
jgi:hypothetical protein